MRISSLSAVKLFFKFFQPLFHPFVHIINPCYVSATSLGSRKTKGNKTGEDLLCGEWGGACVKSVGVRGVSRIREGRPERDEAASPAAIRRQGIREKEQENCQCKWVGDGEGKPGVQEGQVPSWRPWSRMRWHSQDVTQRRDMIQHWKWIDVNAVWGSWADTKWSLWLGTCI